MIQRNMLLILGLMVLFAPAGRSQQLDLEKLEWPVRIKYIDISFTDWDKESALVMDCAHQAEGHVVVLKRELYFQLVQKALKDLTPAETQVKGDIRVRAVISYGTEFDDVLCIGCNGSMFLNGKQVVYSMPLERLIRSAIPMSYYSDLGEVFKAGK